MKDKLNALLDRHVGALVREMEDITDAARHIERLEPEGARALCRRLHRLRGSSGSLGFDAIARAADRLERKLADIAQYPLQPREAARLQELERDLRDCIARVRAADSTLYAQFGLDDARLG